MTEKGEVTGGDDSLIERVSAVLRTPVRLDPSFDARLMAQVRSEAPRLYPVSTAQGSWWRRPIELRISPLAGLALAAGIAGIVALSTLVAPPAARVTAPVVVASAPPATDTVHVVRFVFVDPRATRVELVGDFNEWTPGRTVLAKWANRTRSAAVTLPAGSRVRFRYLGEHGNWFDDPDAERDGDAYVIDLTQP